MYINDVIAFTAKILGLDDPFDDGGEQDKDKLLTAVRIVTDELSRGYFPLEKEENLSEKCGKIEYSTFSRAPIAVKKVRKGGRIVPFTREYDGIRVGERGTVSVSYEYAHKEAKIGDRTEWASDRVPLSLIAYGAAAEYCIMTGQEGDAALWDKRYRDGIENAAFSGGVWRKVKGRRWLL